MERSQSLDFNSIKGAKKRRTAACRKPRTGSSQAFLSDYSHELLLQSSSSLYETRPTTYNGSSSENLSRFSSDDNEYDRGVANKKNNSEGGSYADCHQWETSDGTRSLGDINVAGKSDETRLGRHLDKDGKDACNLKLRKEKIIVEDKFLRKPEGFNDSLKQDLNRDDFKNLRIGNSKRLDAKGQAKPGSNARCSEGVLAPAQTSSSDWINQSDTYPFEDKIVTRAKRLRGKCDLSEADSKPVCQKSDPSSQENRPTKVKLKVGGVTHTLLANHDENANTTKRHVTIKSSSTPHESSSDVSTQEGKIYEENNDDENDHPLWMEKHECALPKSRTDGRRTWEGSRSKSSEENVSPKRTDNDITDLFSSQAVRKSSRVRKRRVLDGEFGDDDNEDEASNQKNKASKRKIANSSFGKDYEEEAPQRRSLRVSKRKVVGGEYDGDEDYFTNKFNKNCKKKHVVEKVSGVILHDNEYIDASGNEDIGNSDLELDVKKKKSIRRELVDSLVKEIPLTARQRALQSVKEADSKGPSKVIEFPDRLAESEKGKQNEKIPDLEQQMKKAEAAQQRRMQVEKAAKEIQAEAIRKILGHDSSREARQDKIRKRQNEIAKEKDAASMGLRSKTVRWVIGPTGTTVSFSEDTGLPSIFTPTTCRYPPPRERCAGPSCSNTYKYRDSKSNLPLCSLQCYQAVNKIQSVSTC